MLSRPRHVRSLPFPTKGIAPIIVGRSQCAGDHAHAWEGYLAPVRLRIVEQADAYLHPSRSSRGDFVPPAPPWAQGHERPGQTTKPAACRKPFARVPALGGLSVD